MSRGLKNYRVTNLECMYMGWGTKFFTAEILVMNLFSGVNMASYLTGIQVAS